MVLTDLDQARVDKGARLRARRGRRAAGQGPASRPTGRTGCSALVTGSTDTSAFADADLVLEAVFEELDGQAAGLRRAGGRRPAGLRARHEHVLAVGDGDGGRPRTTPSASSACTSSTRSPCCRWWRWCAAERTDDATLATAFAVGKALKKSCVLVQDAPAFVFNRLVTRALGEVIAAIDAGTPFEVADRAVDELGLPMSPLVLLQLVGPAVALHTARTLHEAYPDRFGRSPGFEALVAAGKPGRLRVGGRCARGRPRGRRAVAAGRQPAHGRPGADRRPRRAGAGDPADARRGCRRASRRTSTCACSSAAGWGFWNGGITPYLDRTGVAERVTGRRFLDRGAASLP